MSVRTKAVHVVTTRRRYKGKVYEAHLLRRSYREDGKVKNETLANLSHLPRETVELIRRSLRGERFVEVNELFDVVASRPHGHVQAVLTAMRRLGFEKLISSARCRERDLVVAMVASRVLHPLSKLATTRWWHTTTLPEELQVADANEDDLYAAMDWLLKRQPLIEKKLAGRHLHKGGLVLYDLSSSYFEGNKCPLAKRGHSRDRKKGTLQVNYGLVTDSFGCPISVSVFPGNTGDSTTLLPAVDRVRSRFGIESLVIVGDRGMLTQKQITELRVQKGVDWITALKSAPIRDLVDRGALQLGLFDERNLFEIVHPDFPDERLIACRNPELASYRAQKRQDLITATTAKLEKIRVRVEAGRLRGKDKIGIAVGKSIDRHKVGKHFVLDIGDDRFSFSLDQERVATEAALDGIYVIRTSVNKRRLDASGVVTAYKSLTYTERAFRSLKTIDLHVRPIRHWSETRVPAHIFLCMLAYYVQYHMQEVWRSLTFFDETAWTQERADPVAPAPRSTNAQRKARSKTTTDGAPVHSFRTLLDELGTLVRSDCRRRNAADDEMPITIDTQPNETQQKALTLLEDIEA